MRITLTHKQLCCLVGSTQIYKRLNAQQGAYMTKHNLMVCPVSSSILRDYAQLCCDRFTAHLAKCKTAADFNSLHHAYLTTTQRGGTDFLNAVGGAK